MISLPLFGWHDLNGAPGAETTDTTGTNVIASTDVDANNIPDAGSSPSGGPSLDFRAPLNLGQAPSTYRDAAVINLFYWNNVLHDVLANHGFTEASGNFQAINYTGGGVGGDPVFAEAQDGSGTNNANFATPPDGISGRMQMFVFTLSNPNRISSFENGIISHEYAHGLTNRLTGGGANSAALRNIQSRGMGEGWSDFLALIFTQQEGDQALDARGMGTYVLDQAPDGPGIRTERYSYDMSINTKTLDSIAGLFSVHQIGETWASTLWDLTWALIDGDSLDPNFDHAGLGFSTDLHRGEGGNNMALRLVTEALKLQPANPSFTEARDAILQADRLLNCGLYQDTIWRVFARRGMGVGASAGSSATTSVGSAFDIPISLGLDSNIPTYTENELPVAVSPGLTVRNQDAQTISGLTVNVRVRNPDAGDRIFIMDSGDVSTSATQVLVNGSAVANYNINANGRLQLSFLNTASQLSMEAVLQAVGFENTTDGPSSRMRDIEFDIGGNVFQCAQVDVIGVNDSPSIGPTLIGPILEDTTTFIPFEISDIYQGQAAFADVDPGSSMSGLAITQASVNPSEGIWHYSSNGANWEPIGDIADAASSLVLGADASLAFVPAQDFFGIPASLEVHGLDNTYSGGVSDTVTGTRVPFDPALLVAGGPASVSSELSADVIKVNDPPIATVSSVNISIDQGEPVDRILDDGFFLDPDSPPLNWELSPEPGFVFPSWLSLENSTRGLTGTPENRDVGSTRLMLTAIDEENASVSIPVFLNVVNVNDAPTGLRASDDTIQENNVTEPIARLSAIDIDVADQITWSVSDPRFFVRSDELWANTPIDYEAEQTIALELTATDSGSPNLSTTLNLELEVLDVNEHLPIIDGGDILIEDGTEAGTLIRDFDATDADLLQTVTYQLVGDGDNASFTLDPVSGALTINEAADFRQQPSYRLFVQATDNGDPAKSKITQLNVVVEPTNAFPPTVGSGQEFSISEAHGDSASVGIVAAQDDDGDALSFAFTGTSSEFDIDPATGEITTKPGVTLDFESQASYILTVQVTEQTEPNRTATGNVTITVTDANDPPTSISIDNARLRAGRQGLQVGSLSASDPDANLSSYTFTPTDDRFEVVGNLLKLKDDAAFTRSEAGDFELAILVTDNADPSSSATLPVTIEVFDAAPWTNLALPNDVSRDGFIVARDALLVINQLNLTGGGALSDPRSLEELDQPDYDTNEDGFLSSIDALRVINALNQGEGEGEDTLAEAGLAFDASDLERDPVDTAWLSAFYQLEEESRRRR